MGAFNAGRFLGRTHGGEAGEVPQTYAGEHRGGRNWRLGSLDRPPRRPLTASRCIVGHGPRSPYWQAATGVSDAPDRITLYASSPAYHFPRPPSDRFDDGATTIVGSSVFNSLRAIAPSQRGELSAIAVAGPSPTSPVARGRRRRIRIRTQAALRTRFAGACVGAGLALPTTALRVSASIFWANSR